jgi:hypothetical protein
VTAPRPWWASEGPIDGGIDPGQDPLLAHRTARRGDDAEPADPSEPDPASGPDDPGSASGPTQQGPASEICGMCPVCIAARMLGDSRPELLAHLTEAARHVSAAVRTLLDAPGDRGPGPDAPGPGPGAPGPGGSGRDRPRSAGRSDGGDSGMRRIDLD